MMTELKPVEIGPIERMRALRAFFGARAPSAHTLAALARASSPVQIAAGTALSAPHCPPHMVYLVTDGSLSVARAGRPIGSFGPRDAAGALAAFARDEAVFDCVADIETRALALRTPELLALLEDYWELTHGATRALARHARALSRELATHEAFIALPSSTSVSPARPLDFVERVVSLRRTFGFDRSHIDALAHLARVSTERRFGVGELVWRAGEPAGHMLVVVCGQIEAAAASGVLGRFGCGDLVGTLDMLAEEPRWFDARVAHHVVALELDGESVIDAMEDLPDVALDLLRMLAQVTLSLRERVEAARPARAATVRPHAGGR